MCQCARHDSDFHPRFRPGQSWARKHRNTLAPAIAIAIVTLAALGGGLAYQLCPTDIERAEADVARAWSVVNALETECEQQRDDAVHHKARAAHHQKILDQNPGSPDGEWLEWEKVAASRHTQLRAATLARRDNLIHLSTVYRRLLAEAETEVLRAKDARDRGTPFRVAPRVRELLAPVLSAR